jgi:hypothetical protein
MLDSVATADPYPPIFDQPFCRRIEIIRQQQRILISPRRITAMLLDRRKPLVFLVGITQLNRSIPPLA